MLSPKPSDARISQCVQLLGGTYFVKLLLTSEAHVTPGDFPVVLRIGRLTSSLEWPFMNFEPPTQNIQSLTEELERLKSEQDTAISMAVYFGMSKEDARLFDQRRKRIYKLYEALLALKGRNALLGRRVA